MQPFTQCVIETVGAIPMGRVMTYGEVAAVCSSPRASRQVVRVLHTYSRTLGLPWHRVVPKSKVLPETPFIEEHKARLEAEGIHFEGYRIIDG